MLFISSGGVARVFCSPDRPAQFPVFLALMIEMSLDEAKRAHEVKVRVTHTLTAEESGSVTLAFQSRDTPNLNPGENLQVPVTLPLHPAPILHDGPHDIHISVDSGEPRILTAYVMTPPVRQ